MAGHCEQWLGLHPVPPARPVIVLWLVTARLVAGAAISENGKAPDAETLRRQEKFIKRKGTSFFLCLHAAKFDRRSIFLAIQ